MKFWYTIFSDLLFEHHLFPENKFVQLFISSIDFPNPITNKTTHGIEAINCIKYIYEELEGKKYSYEILSSIF